MMTVLSCGTRSVYWEHKLLSCRNNIIDYKFKRLFILQLTHFRCTHSPQNGELFKSQSVSQKLYAAYLEAHSINHWRDHTDSHWFHPWFVKQFGEMQNLRWIFVMCKENYYNCHIKYVLTVKHFGVFTNKYTFVLMPPKQPESTKT